MEAKENIISQIKNRIIKNLHPQKIYLFGSYAKDKMNKDSDIDLLIIKATDLPAHKRGRMVRKFLRNFLIPIDVIVYTPEEEKKWETASISFLSIVKRKGKLLYEK